MSEVNEEQPQLRRLSDGKMYELEGEMIVGRHLDCNIVLDLELSASRKHASFAVVDQDVFVTDLGSLNGTLVNGKLIEEQAQLSDGDILIFDKNEYVVQIPTRSVEPEIDPDKTILFSRVEEPEIDPDKTVIFSREDLAKRQADTLAAQDNNDRELEIEAAAEKEAAAAVEAKAAIQAAAEKEAAAAVEAKAAIEAAAEKEAAAAIEAKAAIEAAAVAAQQNTPERQENATPAAANRPGSWANSAAVDNPDLTMIAGGIAVQNALAAEVDLTSIAEPTVIVQTGENAGALMQLVGEQTEWSIGSSTDRDLQITQTGVSSNHAAIVREGSKWKIVDQMSVNGTFVNGERINVRYFTDSDVLRFGPVECLFVVPAGFKEPKKSSKNKEKSLPIWKIALPIAILLILGGGYYAYSTGMFP